MSFDDEVNAQIASNGQNRALRDAAAHFLELSIPARYSYNFAWAGRPIIQYPQDIVALQELVWRVRPDLIIETGIAHGGSLMLSASLLAMLDYCDAVEKGQPLDPRATKRRVLGVDIDIRAHNKFAVEGHPLSHMIHMIEGSSTDAAVANQVARVASAHHKIFVCLDSNHTHDHVLAELEIYAPLTSLGSYCCVFDTLIEGLPDHLFRDRPWSRGNSPGTAVTEYLLRLQTEGRTGADGHPLRLEVDRRTESKLLVTAAPGGYLQRKP